MPGLVTLGFGSSTIGIYEYLSAKQQFPVFDLSVTEVVLGPPGPEAARGRGGAAEEEDEAR